MVPQRRWRDPATVSADRAGALEDVEVGEADVAFDDAGGVEACDADTPRSALRREDGGVVADSGSAPETPTVRASKAPVDTAFTERRIAASPFERTIPVHGTIEALRMFHRPQRAPRSAGAIALHWDAGAGGASAGLGRPGVQSGVRITRSREGCRYEGGTSARVAALGPDCRRSRRP